MPRYRIREVDGDDDDIAEEIRALHVLTFFKDAPQPQTDHGHWWLAHYSGDAVAFAGMIPSTIYPNMGYFSRVGVLPQHRGSGLQLRFMRAIESRARRNGWLGIVSDTTDNPPSANNFIRSGYRIIEPAVRWAFPHSIYWRKDFAAAPISPGRA